MRSKKEIPPAPDGCHGWPWTGSLDADTGSSLEGPLISIVTPSFNQGAYIEETIRSILLQDYQRFEYIVVDACSTDSTKEILSKYKEFIDVLVIEPDDGQADAINKGLALCSGDVFQFINSDDILAQGALKSVARLMQGADAVAGAVENFGMGTREKVQNANLSPLGFVRYVGGTSMVFHQPGIFLRRALLNQVGGFPKQLRFTFDLVGLALYFEKYDNIVYTDSVLVHFRLHAGSKTIGEGLGFGIEDIRARKILADNFSRKYNRIVAGYHVSRLNMIEEVSLARGKNGWGMQTGFVAIRKVVSNPFLISERFLLSAILRCLKNVFGAIGA